MPDREKVIRGLEYCMGGCLVSCSRCPYHDVGEEPPDCLDNCRIMQDAVELLKEQEPVTPKEERLDDVDSIFRCGNCGVCFYLRQQKYCAICGRKAKWDE